MRIGILSRNPTLYSTRRLAQAIWARGHQAQIIDTTAIAVHLGAARAPAGAPQVLTANAVGLASPSPLPPLDAVIPRIGTSVTFYGLAVVRQFETAGVFSAASSDAIARSRDKLHSLQVMAQAGLPIPRTAVVARPEALLAAVQAVGGLPAVVKLIRGTQGRGVLLADHVATIAAMLRRAEELNQQAIIQEYIAEAAGRDLRIIVVGNRPVAAMERHAPPDDFRANLHQGGSAEPVTLDRPTAALAVAAARAHGLAVAGVDVLLSRRGPLLLEVNSSPGLEGIEKTTGVDVAEAIVAYVESAAGRPRRG